MKSIDRKDRHPETCKLICYMGRFFLKWWTIVGCRANLIFPCYNICLISEFGLFFNFPIFLHFPNFPFIFCPIFQKFEIPHQDDSARKTVSTKAQLDHRLKFDGSRTKFEQAMEEKRQDKDLIWWVYILTSIIHDIIRSEIWILSDIWCWLAAAR